MNCPRCGTNNSKTSKYCRECGKRLAVEGLDFEVLEEPVMPPDDAAVAELLYETLKLYERGKTEAAFAKCRQALKLNPNSPSGHSLLGLIYERKAAEQAEHGNRVDSEDYLRAAIRQIDRVLEANPDSVADREKLAELQAKLDGVAEIQAIRRPPLVSRIGAAARRLSLPWAATSGTVVVVLIVMLAILGGGSKTPGGSKGPAQALPAPPAQGTAAQPQAYPRSTAPAWSYSPQQPSTALPPQVYPPEQEDSSQITLPLTPAPDRIVPVPAEQRDRFAAAPPRPAPPPQPRPDTTASAPPAENPVSERARAAFLRGDYQSAATLYDEAIARGENTAENHQSLGMCHYNLGRKDAAISHFERAVQLYLDQKARGVDVDAADRGIQACKLFIEAARH